MNHKLYQLIGSYSCKNEQEKRDQEFMLKIIKDFPDVTTRNNKIAHFTASPWILNQAHTKVLMVYHHIYDSWSWCGGHLDGCDDPLKKALDDGKEETGLKEISVLLQEPLAIDLLPVHGHYKKHEYVSSHLHLNITYLCEADENALLHNKADENSAAAWFMMEELKHIVSEKTMLPVYEKLNKAAMSIVRK